MRRTPQATIPTTERKKEKHKCTTLRSPGPRGDVSVATTARLPVDARALTEAIEDWLGDPELESNALSFGRGLEADEREELPDAGIERLRGFGFHRYFVPARLGGELRSAEQLLMLTSAIARINRGATSTHVVVLGATGDEDTPARRRHSLFLVDRARVLSGEVDGLPRLPTYGLRGCDISGVAFRDARVDPSCRLGGEGEGLELALRGLLITRTLCTGLSLGTGDTMLRTAGGFLSRRKLYNGAASEIPYISESLANAYLSLLVAECESLVAMRGLHLYPEEFSLCANLAKVQVARLVDANARVLARALGARSYCARRNTRASSRRCCGTAPSSPCSTAASRSAWTALRSSSSSWPRLCARTVMTTGACRRGPFGRRL
jgi:alkylation response protein AidB-like acyl-CoA dehydrogenase